MYLPNTGMNYFWLLWDPHLFCRGFRRAQNWAFLPLLPLVFLCLSSPLVFLRLMLSNVFQRYSPGTGMYFNSFFVPLRSIQGMYGFQKGPEIEHFYHFLGCFTELHFGSFKINLGSPGASKGPRIEHFPVPATYWAVLGPHELIISKCFPEVLTRYWHVFSGSFWL